MIPSRGLWQLLGDPECVQQTPGVTLTSGKVTRGPLLTFIVCIVASDNQNLKNKYEENHPDG